MSKHRSHANGPRDDFVINPHSDAKQEMPELGEFVIPQHPAETKEEFLDRLEKDFPTLSPEIRAEREADEEERRELPAKEREERKEPERSKKSRPVETGQMERRFSPFSTVRNPGQRIIRPKKK